MLHHVHHIVHVWDGLDTIIGQTLDIYGHKGWFHIMSHNEHTSPYNIPCRRGLLHYRTLWAGGKLWNINGTSQVAITFLVIVMVGLAPPTSQQSVVLPKEFTRSVVTIEHAHHK
jgi:hypothetical protein